MIDKSDISGLILAGGDGSRPGGGDPGLASHLGMPVAMHVLLRLAPQVGVVAINANRNLSAYESMGVPVWSDMAADVAGAVAGLLTGLERCETRYLVTVPCDASRLPTDLVGRLAQALVAHDAEIAMLAPGGDGGYGARTAACLLKAELLESLHRFIRSGQREMQSWVALHRSVVVQLDDAGVLGEASKPQGLRPPDAN